MKPIENAVAETLSNADHIDDIKLAASKMSLIDRRAFQVSMAIRIDPLADDVVKR